MDSSFAGGAKTKHYRLLSFIAIAAIVFLGVAAFAGEDVTLYDQSGRVLKPAQIDSVSVRKTCGDCHDVDACAKSLHFNKSEAKPDPEASSCLSCHLPKSNAFTPAGTITKTVAIRTADNCIDCHSDVADTLAKSVHGGADIRPGDHPTCVSCHSGNPHSIRPPAEMKRAAKFELCSGCHSNGKQMRRYGVNPHAVSSYEQSFHGKALLRFGKEKSAVCTDCHGSHAVAKPVTGKHGGASKSCVNCHKGAKMNFAMSGANHLQLKIERTPILWIEELLFKLLTYGTMAFLLGMIALDLRKKAFCRDCAPRSGRAIAILISLSFASLVAGLILAAVGLAGAEWAWIVAVGLMVCAFAFYAATKQPHKPEKKLYQRFTAAQRAQHICLAVSFTVLVLTGMPLRFAHVGWSHYLHLLFGGFEGARIAHRMAAVLMTGTWLWHFFFLLYRWKQARFALSSWTMMPTKKDFTDFFDTLKFGLGLSPVRPRYDRFQFREKFDYFAVYWGMPIMVFSGAVLWFPVYLSNKLTDLGFGIAYIAHSDEGLLALLAILIWHLYNTHLDPEHFPMNPVWYSGVMSESDMEREHPVEKAKLDEKSEGQSLPRVEVLVTDEKGDPEG